MTGNGRFGWNPPGQPPREKAHFRPWPGTCTLPHGGRLFLKSVQDGCVRSLVPRGGLDWIVQGAGMVEPIAEPVQPVAKLDRRPVAEEIRAGQPALAAVRKLSTTVTASGSRSRPESQFTAASSANEYVLVDRDVERQTGSSSRNGLKASFREVAREQPSARSG